MKRRRFTLLTIYLFYFISSAACVITCMTLRLRLKFPLTSLTINSHRGREVLRFENDRSLIVALMET